MKDNTASEASFPLYRMWVKSLQFAFAAICILLAYYAARTGASVGFIALLGVVGGVLGVSALLGSIIVVRLGTVAVISKFAGLLAVHKRQCRISGIQQLFSVVEQDAGGGEGPSVRVSLWIAGENGERFLICQMVTPGAPRFVRRLGVKLARTTGVKFRRMRLQNSASPMESWSNMANFQESEGILRADYDWLVQPVARMALLSSCIWVTLWAIIEPNMLSLVLATLVPLPIFIYLATTSASIAVRVDGGRLLVERRSLLARYLRVNIARRVTTFDLTSGVLVQTRVLTSMIENLVLSSMADSHTCVLPHWGHAVEKVVALIRTSGYDVHQEAVLGKLQPESSA